MNNTVKFRYWDKNKNEMVYVEGIFNKRPWTETSTFAQYESHQKYHDVEIMQFTGLKDKDGVEIYDDDIVYAHMNSTRYIVKHGLYDNLQIDNTPSPNCYGWYITSDSKPRYNEYFDGESLQGSGEFLTVVGNIYQNPGLLE